LGLICVRKYKADERGSGIWDTFPPAPEIDREAFDAITKSLAAYREQFMFGRPHLNIDHFGVDTECQGRGLGKLLLAKACAIADCEKMDMFVQANQFAENFYQKYGFETQQKLEMPGGMTECFLVRKFNPGLEDHQLTLESKAVMNAVQVSKINYHPGSGSFSGELLIN
jgi:GNAT superfamily N-acetyltransferase